MRDTHSGCVLRQVDVYSFSMIAYQLFELTPPFSGMDPVDAARKAALAEERPPLMRLATQMPTMRVCRSPISHYQKLQQTVGHIRESSLFCTGGRMSAAVLNGILRQRHASSLSVLS